jgi:hypothetical protein
MNVMLSVVLSSLFCVRSSRSSNRSYFCGCNDDLEAINTARSPTKGANWDSNPPAATAASLSAKDGSDDALGVVPVDGMS